MHLRRAYYGWWIVAIGFLVNAANAGFYFTGFSVFFLPISRDLNLSRTAASLPFSVARGVSAVQSPILGSLVDRLGPSRVLLVAVAMAGVGYILLGVVHSYLLFLLVFILVISPAMQGGFDTPSMVAVTRWFVRRRRMAMALSTMGFAVGGGIITPLLAVSIGGLGWRPTSIAVGVLVIAVLIPLSTRLYPSPESRGLQLDGGPRRPQASVPGEGGGRDEAPLENDFTLRQALGKLSYWSLGSSLAIRGLVSTVLAVHLVALMVSNGISESTAGLMVGLYSLARIPTMLLMAVTANRWPPQRVIALGGFCGAISLLFFFLLEGPELWLVALLLVLLAFNDGSWTVAWSIVAEQFGRFHFGALRGGILAMVSVGSIGGPIFAGWVFDRFGSYEWIMLPGCVGLVVAGLLNWTMPKTRADAGAAAPDLPPAP